MQSNYYGSYSIPKLIDYKGDISKKWFIKYTWQPNEGDKKFIQLRGEINKHTTVKARRKQAQEDIIAELELLEANYNPETKRTFVRQYTPAERWLNMPLEEALKEMLNKNRNLYADGTFQQYRLAVGYFGDSIKELQEQMILPDPLTIKDIKPSVTTLIMDNYKGSNYSHNKIYNYVCAVGRHVAKAADLSYNPLAGVDKKPEAETEGFIKPTDVEQVLIREHLEANHVDFLRAILVTYHTGIRLKEVLKLRIRDIKGNSIRIIPDLVEENSKTKKIRLVPVNKHLQKYFDDMNLGEYPPDYYVFGKKEKGHRTDLVLGPSSKPVSKRHLTYKWKRIVKDELGLKCHAYGLKHKGADDKILADIPIEALQEMYGHTTKQMSMKYISVLKQIHAKHIIDKSPDF